MITGPAHNLAWWEERAALHGQDDTYDERALLAGRSTLHAAERDLAGDVTGLRIVHLQCHIGHDTLSWARAGAAHVTGIDFSPTAISRAESVCAAAGYADRTRFIVSDVLALPAELTSFDLAVATYGVLNWIDDVGAWMRSAAGTLRPGGRLVFAELHPLLVMAGSVDPLVLDWPYTNVGPQRNEESGTYADHGAQTSANVTVEFAHSVGEVVTAAAAAGFRIEALVENTAVESDGRNLLHPEADGWVRWRIDGMALPLAYAFAATVG